MPHAAETVTLRRPGARPMLPLDIAGLTLAVDSRRLVDDLTLRLKGSGLTVIMGPNGAGKSLLLRLIHGLIRPTAGAISWGGVPMSAGLRVRQAMVFQRPVLLRRSVAANIDFVLGLRGAIGARAAAERRDRLLDRVGLLGHARQSARLLSGGEQQRLALARALAVEPEVLFLDEATASLDPASTQMIEEIVLAERGRGTKVIFVTHDIGQARRLADDVVFLHRGRLVEHRPARQFFDDPSSPPARAYLDGRIVL